MAVSFLDARRAAAKLEIENYETLSPKDKLIAAVSDVLGEDVSVMDSDQLKKSVENYIENGAQGGNEPEPVEDDEQQDEIPTPEEPAEGDELPAKEEEKSAPKPARTKVSSRTRKVNEEKQTVNIIRKEEEKPTPEPEHKLEENPDEPKCYCDQHESLAVSENGSLKPGAMAIMGVAKFLDSLSKSLMELNHDLSIGNLSK
jgi:hypothetical protein